MEEIWKPLIGYENEYEVSNLGRLKSLPKLVDYGRAQANRKERILSFRVGRLGYLYTVISSNKIRKTVKMHRLVAKTFIPNPNNYPQVNHIDGNKLNNIVDNLEWCTAKENVNHAYNTGLHKGVKGEKSHYAKLSEKQILEIRELRFKHRIFIKHLADDFKISESQVQRICNGTNWGHVLQGINGIWN